MRRLSRVADDLLNAVRTPSSSFRRATSIKSLSSGSGSGSSSSPTPTHGDFKISDPPSPLLSSCNFDHFGVHCPFLNQISLKVGSQTWYCTSFRNRRWGRNHPSLRVTIQLIFFAIRFSERPLAFDRMDRLRLPPV
jgi:hypothetical protein